MLKNLLVLGLLFVSVSVLADEPGLFPGRDKYPDNQVIEIDDLFNNRDKYQLIDARSKFEFDVIHINDSINIPVNSRRFNNELQKFGKDQSLVFYCNGHSCMKSHKAAHQAKKLGYNNVWAYDDGVFVWAKRFPEMTTLFENTPADISKLLSQEQFNKHLLPLADFKKKLAENSKVVLWDIRDSKARKQKPFYDERSVKVSLNNTFSLSSLGKLVSTKDKVFVIDSSGRQVKWLQYYLEEHKIKDYYFLKGGVNSI